MPHTVEGFMKKSQTEKFVRNRDIKLKEKEIRKEEKIQKGMCEGVCPQCRDKAQWRFTYGKYKPLKKVAGCSSCRQKTVIKAYRALCDKCASAKKVCPGCCADVSEQHLKRKERNEYLGVDPDAVIVVDRTTAPAMYTGKKEDEEEEEDEDEEEEEEGDEDENDQDEMEQDEAGSGKKLKTTPIAEESATSNYGVASWNSDRFEKIAATKYSKDRVVGATEDSSGNVFQFANGKTPDASAAVMEEDTTIMDSTLS
jgi:hypothetical protein